MKTDLSLHIFKKFLIATILVASFFFSSIQNSFAVVDQVRDTGVDDYGFCQTKPLKFDPTGFGDTDIFWEYDNPVCLAFIGGAGLQYKIAMDASSALCLNWFGGVNAFGPPISPGKIREMIKNSGKCGTFLATQNYGYAAVCCGSLGASAATLGIAVAELSGIWAAANGSKANAHVCGERWDTWEEFDAGDVTNGISGFGANENLQYTDKEGEKQYWKDHNGVEKKTSFYKYGKNSKSYHKYLGALYDGAGAFTASYEDYSTNNAVTSSTPPVVMTRSIENKFYREFIYGGIEYEDRGASFCTNPVNWANKINTSEKTKAEKILGYNDVAQRYYMRGSNQASNYACGRFLLSESTDESKAAYECCKKRSQETMCIDDSRLDDGHSFCKRGEDCRILGITYDVYESKVTPNRLCAKTYSVCPYNHNLGGGTEIIQYDDKHGKMLNHCQYLKHCVKIPDVPYIRTRNLDGGWISSACFDLKGDSQNNYEFNAPLTPLNKTKNFSAPIAQCFKETLENMFLNKAGNTKCTDVDEDPDQYGNCNSGYLYKEGEFIEGQVSFFQTIQSKFQLIIKLVMTLAIVMLGIKILLTGETLKRKDISMFLIKLGLVSYFALGTAWQDHFFKGVSSITADLSGIFMKLDNQNKGPELLDGCQFPKYNYADTNPETTYDNPAYPPGKEYLKIWDMLDCKIVSALGFGPSVSVPNLAIMIVAGLITSGLGMIFFIATFVFAFYLIALTVRALHIFLIASMAITIMIYISPLTICACLFEKTKDIFNGWKDNLISFVLQPVILFVYLGLVIVIFEKVVIGDAQFTGSGREVPKNIVCSAGEAANNSIYCIFKFDNLENNNALSALGIALANLFDPNFKDKLPTIIKAAFLMYILTRFLDQIPDFAQKLLGGLALTSASGGTGSLLSRSYKTSAAIRKRGSRATRKFVPRILQKISEKSPPPPTKKSPKDGGGSSSNA